MLLFSVKKGKLPKNVQGRDDLPGGISFAIYLNIVAIIVLAEPGERFSYHESQDGPGTFGVRTIEKEMPEVPEVGVSEEEEPYL